MTLYRTDPTYLDFYGYNSYKSRFRTDISYKNDEEIRKIIEEYMQKLPRNRSNLLDAFYLIITYLKNGGVLYSDNGYDACRYISYRIHEKIRELNFGVCDEDTFKLIKDFVAIYNEKEHNNYCKTYINYIEDDVYRKMKLLYELFDKYISLKKLKNDSSSCDTLHFLVHSYNDVIKDYKENDSYLFNKIKDLKYIIETSEWKSNTTCGYRVKHLLSLEPDNSHEKQVQQNQNKESESHQAAMQQKRDAHDIESTTALKDTDALQVQAELNARTELPRGKTLQEEQALKLGSAFQGEDVLESGKTFRERSEFPKILSLSVKENENPVQGMSLLVNTGDGVENEIPSGEAEMHHVVDPRRIPQDPQNFLGTMKNGISGFMNEVEPAPILGVSGGMGALFLLFKYTPVGTFFRGGRRINNRIPRTFYGQFAGGPAGYDDFYEGSFGPGPINISYRPELE
ncbi:VIR protein [Plasmodium vivax]|uniref:VIR protein n=1 Tax=Plasmodium vivax TaxID=5855 RepID=A0A1G4E7N7_PLAVI|nr:VIR protein [Plasmodium vivax]